MNCTLSTELFSDGDLFLPPLQGMINLVLECIDRLHVYSSAAHFADVAGREAGESWKSILNSLYELLGKGHGCVSMENNITAVVQHASKSGLLSSNGIDLKPIMLCG